MSIKKIVTLLFAKKVLFIKKELKKILKNKKESSNKL